MPDAPLPDAARPPAETGTHRARLSDGPGGRGSAPASAAARVAALFRGTRERSDRPSRTGRAFAVIAVIEAVTWTGLLVGMFLKYVTETTELGVYVFGRLHGAAFVLYVIITLAAAARLRWGWKPALVAGLAAIPPLATLPVEVALRRRGYLRHPADGVDDARRTVPAGVGSRSRSRGA